MGFVCGKGVQFRSQTGEGLALFRDLMTFSCCALSHSLVVVESFAVLLLPSREVALAVRDLDCVRLQGLPFDILVLRLSSVSI